jgi:hypothetical protein
MCGQSVACPPFECATEMVGTAHSRLCATLRIVVSNGIACGHTFAASPRMSELFWKHHALERPEGAGNAGCPLHPWPPVQQKSTGAGTTGTPDRPAFPARWLYGLYVLSPVTIAWLPPSAARRVSVFATLTPASERQDHTTSPSAPASFVNAPPKRPSHPAPNVRDDREAPLLIRAGHADGTTDLVESRSEIFSAWGTGRPKSR